MRRLFTFFLVAAVTATAATVWLYDVSPLQAEAVPALAPLGK